ncbi:HTH_48 domain-containing protein [Trichonephila clavipes]|nr:HTH_48 domain-containing protein [Trichonephila clavipes]
MFKLIESPAKCEIRTVIRISTARNMSAADIHHQITKFMTQEQRGRHSVITDDLMHAVETKIHENRRFTIFTLLLEFPDVSRSVVYKIVIVDLNLKKLCSRRVPRLLAAEHKEKRFAISLDFLIRYEEEENMTC